MRDLKVDVSKFRTLSERKFHDFLNCFSVLSLVEIGSYYWRSLLLAKSKSIQRTISPESAHVIIQFLRKSN